jgi:hypothetical protein
MIYSNPTDITDELIRPISKIADHQAAEEYVDKVLSYLGFNFEFIQEIIECGANLDKLSILPQIKALSITFATYRGAFRKYVVKGDPFHKVYLEQSKRLHEQTCELLQDKNIRFTGVVA